MPEERAQRRLAAILAADVVGYSRMMKRARSRPALRDHRRLSAWPARDNRSSNDLPDPPLLGTGSSKRDLDAAVLRAVSVVRLFETDSGMIEGRIWRIC
jgi:hypothetical protein